METIGKVAALLVPLTIAIVFHEVAHGGVAKLFGDRTASDLGRLSLNPIRHIDLFGTLLLPMILALSSAPIFGWAKPVPVNPNRLRNPRWHMVAVAAAGPASNIILAFLAMLILFGLFPVVVARSEDSGAAKFLVENFRNFIEINLYLAVFNLIPMPPFDGSKVLAGFLPDGLRARWQSLDRYALLFMIGLLVVLPQLAPQLNLVGKIVGPPLQWLFTALMRLAALIV